MTSQPSRAPLATEHLIASLTLEEKASLLSGRDFWHTQAIERDGVAVPSVMVTDGPHGLRKQAEGGATTSGSAPPSRRRASRRRRRSGRRGTSIS